MDRHGPRKAPARPPLSRRELGTDAGRGNLLGIQPWLTPGDYASATRLEDVLDGYFAEAARGGLLGERTIAVLPEYLGTWLLAAHEKAGVYTAPSMRQAMTLLAASSAPAFLARWLTAREADRATATALRLHAHRTAALYHHVMRRLAQRWRVHLVGGALLLPAPYIDDGVLRAGAGPLYNVAPVYGPDGRLLSPLACKAYPTADERPFVTPAPEPPPVYDTPAGRLGVLICADAWFPEPYAALRAHGVELIAVPSFAAWDTTVPQPWTGYSGWPAPADVDPADEGRLSRAAAWAKYALAGRLAASGARAGVNVFFQGRFWNLPLTGPATGIGDGGVLEVAPGDAAAFVNVWL
jgi:predicted amidohydrolase